MKIYIVGCLFFVFGIVKTFGQQPVEKKQNIAIFSNLYLDSAFGEKGYRFGKLIPPFAVSGVEFLYGTLKAIDSIKKLPVLVNYYLYDAKSGTKPISNLISSGALDSMDMLIGSVSGNEVKQLADFALQKKIPFISATHPNDVGISNNPSFLILNSTLKTNCRSLYDLVSKKFRDQRIVLITKSGKQEERITGYFKEFEKNADTSLAMTIVNLESDLSDSNIEQYLDSTVLSSYIVASTDVSFAKQIAKLVAKNKQQDQVNLMGLPTWDNFSDFSSKEFNGLHFYYVTPMAKPKSVFATGLESRFKSKYGSTPGDNMFRGFETVFSFSRLLLKHKGNLLDNLSDNSFKVFSGYNIQPVFLHSGEITLDYFENKKLCLMKKFNGVTTQINP